MLRCSRALSLLRTDVERCGAARKDEHALRSCAMMVLVRASCGSRDLLTIHRLDGESAFINYYVYVWGSWMSASELYDFVSETPPCFV